MPDPSSAPPLNRSRRDVVVGAALLSACAPFEGQAAAPTGRDLTSILDFGVRGGNDPEDGARLQRAFDEAPLGGVLYFPPGEYRTRQPLVLRRQLNLIGAGARLTGDFGTNDAADLIEVNVEDPANRDNRLQRIEGLRLWMVAGGRNTLAVRNRPPNSANIGLSIARNLLAAPAGGSGSALWLDGIGTHHVTITNNQIENGIRVTTADGITIENCMIFGEKAGIVLDLVPGGFQTRIRDNAIVSRDGALDVVNGSQIYFENNQVEQFPGYGRNRSRTGAHVTIAPRAYGARHIRIRSNNFGGGDYARASIHAAGDCQDLLIDDNVFNVLGGDADIVLADAAVAWTRIGPNNSARGPLARRRHLTEGEPLAISDRGTGSFNVRKGAEALGLGSAWRASAGFRFWKSLDGILFMQGSIERAAGAGESLVGTLPIGFRPAGRAPLLAARGSGEAVILWVEADGRIICPPNLSGRLALDGATLALALRPPYPPADP